jgi:hypothetical protein
MPARLGVRERPVRPRGDRRVEGDVVGAVSVHQLAQAPRDVPLRPPDPRLGRQRLERALGDFRGTPDGRQLGVVLDRAQPLDHARRRDEVEPTGREHLELRVRERVRLERELPLESPGEVAQQRALRHHRLDALHALRRLQVAEVREELRVARGVDEQGGVRALEARQVEDVRQVRDEERSVEARPQPLEPLRQPAAPTRYSSASR